MRSCWNVGVSNGPAGVGVEVVADKEAVEASFSDERHRLVQIQPLIEPLVLFCAIQSRLPPRSKVREAVCIAFTFIIIMVVFSDFTGRTVAD